MNQQSDLLLVMYSTELDTRLMPITRPMEEMGMDKIKCVTSSLTLNDRSFLINEPVSLIIRFYRPNYTKSIQLRRY